MSAGTAPAGQGEYEIARDIGLEAFVYGLPLVTMDVTFRTMTSTTVTAGAFGPVNQFHHVRATNGAGGTAVVAPGATSLSSIAWLDLRAGPMVLHIPDVVDRHWMLALEDPYTEDVQNLSSANGTAAGDYVIVGPDHRQDTTLPAGATRIDVSYNRIWVIGSTQLKGPDDVAAAERVQDGYTLVPLDHLGEEYTAPVASPAVLQPVRATFPQGLAFLDALGELLAAFPPPASDAPLLARLATVGIGPGLTPSHDGTLAPETVRGLADGVAAGPDHTRELAAGLFAKSAAGHNGYLVGGFGRYGTNDELRAVISQVGLGAVSSEQAIFAMARTDVTGRALRGDATYVIHLDAPPPTREGWSLTVYDASGGLVANPLDRHAFTDASPLARNADGSVDILLQVSAPAEAAAEANWLPVPAGAAFEVTWRLFAPEASAISGILDGSGWRPPVIQPEP